MNVLTTGIILYSIYQCICMDHDNDDTEKQKSQETNQNQPVQQESQPETSGLTSGLPEQPVSQDQQGSYGVSGPIQQYKPVKSKKKLRRNKRYRYKPYQTKPHGPKKSGPHPGLSPKKLPVKPKAKKTIPHQTYELTSYGYWPTQSSPSIPQTGPYTAPDTQSQLPAWPMVQPPIQPAPHVPPPVLGYARHRLDVPHPIPWPHPTPGHYPYSLPFPAHPRYPIPQFHTPTQQPPQTQELLHPEVVQLEVESDEEGPLDLTTPSQQEGTQYAPSTGPQPTVQPQSKPESPSKPTSGGPEDSKELKLIDLEISSTANPNTYYSEVQGSEKTYLLFLADVDCAFKTILEQGNLILELENQLYAKEVTVTLVDGLVLKLEILLINGDQKIIETQK